MIKNPSFEGWVQDLGFLPKIFLFFMKFWSRKTTWDQFPLFKWYLAHLKPGVCITQLKHASKMIATFTDPLGYAIKLPWWLPCNVSAYWFSCTRHLCQWSGRHHVGLACLLRVFLLAILDIKQHEKLVWNFFVVKNYIVPLHHGVLFDMTMVDRSRKENGSKAGFPNLSDPRPQV